MPAQYQIICESKTKNTHNVTVLRGGSLEYCNQKIRDYAEAWRNDAKRVIHNPGESVIFFGSETLTYWRSGQILDA